MGKVALAPAKRRGVCSCTVLHVWWRRNAAVDAAAQGGAKTTKMAQYNVHLPGWRDAWQQQ